ncbi:MAG: hypothetical protein AABY07_05465 [Nanoarchaeota archaeon]
MFKAISPKQIGNHDNAINISSYGSRPYNLFSPFTYSPDFKIPVTGQENMYANSVESIWQGLKVINGQTDPELFTQKPRKRRGNVQGHLLGCKLLDIAEARDYIYRPSYFYYLENYIPKEIKDDLLIKVFDQWEVNLYDVENNLDIKIPEPLAHSFFASEYLNSYLDNQLVRMREKIDSIYDKTLPEQTISEPLTRAVRSLKNSTKFEIKLASHFLRSNKQVRNIYHARYYVRLFEMLERL